MKACKALCCSGRLWTIGKGLVCYTEEFGLYFLHQEKGFEAFR